MTKREIFDALRGVVSRKAITQSFDCSNDNEWAVVGHYCRIVPNEQGWDVWLCRPRDLTAGLGTGKRNNIVVGIANLLSPDGAPYDLATAAKLYGWKLLDGEAWTRNLGTEDILACLKLLGIRRKKIMSAEQIAASSERIAAMRSTTIQQPGESQS
jgi:hypothetical protein